MAVLELEPMAKTRGRPKKSERDDVSVKLDRAVVGMAKLIATHRGITVAELLTEIARPGVSRAYGELLRELQPPK